MTDLPQPPGEPVRTVPAGPPDPVAAGTVGSSDVARQVAASVDAEQAVPPPSGLWQTMKADPQYAPEHLALEAVRRIGPQAQQWAEVTRRYFPGAHPDQLADIAVKKFTNLARLSGAVSGAAGLPGAVVDMGVLAWTQARMVLHIAAVYGVDPTHPDRATDLLVLQRVHKAVEGARLALGVAAGRERFGALLTRAGGTPMSRALLQLGVKLAGMAGVRAARRLFAKMVPGAAIILGTWANSSATKELARRTVQLYRKRALPPRHP